MTTTSDTTAQPQIPTGPLLSQLAGMSEARRWGEALAEDIKLYRAGKLDWSEIDAGIVVHGPPGTGKTTFARALAASTRLPLIATSYADWNRGNVYVSTIIDAIRAIFETAQEHAPCVVAIDELDSLPSRELMTSERSTGTHMIVNALLEQLDGLNTRKGVVVVATCNHPRRLDPALVRPGRLGRSIHIPLPDRSALPKIIAFHLKSDATRIGDLAGIAVMCVGMSGATIEQLVREARQTARRHGQTLQRAHLMSVLEARAASLSKEDARRAAIHEAGHGVAAICLSGAKGISLSIVPTEESTGRMLARPAGPTVTRESVRKQLAILLAGRAAEEILLGEPSGNAGGGADSDLARASELALGAVTMLGLSKSGGAFWYGAHRDLGIHHVPGALHDEARKMIDDALAEAKALLTRERAFVLAVADALVSRRALADGEIAALDPSRRRNSIADRLLQSLAIAHDDPYPEDDPYLHISRRKLPPLVPHPIYASPPTRNAGRRRT